ncbi:MAG TPA: stalk domain-containing protein, partial [Bacillota bacterium]|nr:stalk domain-containing protein [Bacillota bacterium]
GLSLGGGSTADISLTENADYILAAWRITATSGKIADLGQVGLSTVAGVPANVQWATDAGANQGETYLVQLVDGNYARCMLTSFSAGASPSGTIAYAVSQGPAAQGSGNTTTSASPTVSAQASAGGAALSWSAVPGASGYYVYRGTTTGGEGSTPLMDFPLTATQYTDTQVTAGQTYFYTVTAVFGGQVQTQSQPSAEVSVSVPAPAAPPASGQSVVTMTVGSTQATVNGKAVPLDVPPMIVGGRTLVPLRFLGDAIGAQVGWNGQSRQVTFTTSAHTVTLTIDQATATVDGQSVTLDVPPTIVGGRTLVPLRFVAEKLGGSVGFDAATMGITVSFAAGAGGNTNTSGGNTSLGAGAKPTGGSCTGVTVGASTAQVAGQGRIIFDYNGGAGTIETVDPTTGAITGQTTYPILQTMRYDPATGNTAGFPYLADKFPRLSPDGSHVSLGLEVVGSDGSTNFLQGNWPFNWTSAEWSPDGRYLAYQGAGGSYLRGQVYIADTTTGQGCLAVPGAAADYVKWLPGGGLVYSTDNGLYQVSADLSQYAPLAVQTGQIVDGNAGKGPNSAGDFDLSPDGAKVTWASPDSSGTPQIWISNLNGSGRVQLTHNSGGDVTPRFSPDGTKIAYVDRTGSSPGQLWVMNLDGSAATAQETNGGVMVRVLSIEQWSPGGNVDGWPSQAGS